MPMPSWGAGASFGGDPQAPFFGPPSCDTVLREHYWFYQNATEQSTKSLKELVLTYFTSVGRAANLILNIAPDFSGAVPTPDVVRYAEMGAAIKCLFNRTVAKSSAPMKMDPATGILPGIEFPVMPASATQNLSVVVREDQTSGQLIANFSLECKSTAAGPWVGCPPGSLSGAIPFCHAAGSSSACMYVGMGHKRVLVLGTLPNGLAGIRIVVHSHFATGDQIPTVRDLEMFDWSGPTESCV